MSDSTSKPSGTKHPDSDSSDQPDGAGSDPRTREPEGDEGMPGPLLDTPHNMPGDQPEEDDPPTVSEVYGRD